jgi:cysteinyl-tRNA synthetase
MAEQHLGETSDIHGGGQDLVFPHHENETAQSVCAHDGAAYARYWVHNGLVSMDQEKMSKSLGNVSLVRDLVAEFPGEAVRLGLLTAHYRQPLDWTAQLLVDSKRRLDRMYGALREAGLGEPSGPPSLPPPAGVAAALADDLNTPEALTELAELVKAVNRAEDAVERRALGESLRAGAWLLGLLQQDPEIWFETAGVAGAGGPGEAEIDALLRERESLREQRRFAEADRIRDDLAARGVIIEDGDGASRWRRA